MLHALTAGAIAMAVTGVELLTRDYPHTAWAAGRSLWLYLLCALYFALAFVAMLSISGLVESGGLQIEGLAVDNPWMQAVAIGLSVKALLHIRWFTVGAGKASVPIGTELVVAMFEPLFLKKLEYDEWDGVQGFIAPYAECYPTVEAVAEQLRSQSVPMPKDEFEAFISDVERQRTAVDALELCLRRFGRRVFKRLFPCK